MDEKIATSLNELLGYVKATADFASEQAPLVAQEIVRWGIASSIVTMIHCVAFIGVAFVFARWMYPRLVKEFAKGLSQQSDGLLVGGSAGMILAATGTLIAFFSLVDAVQALVKAIVSPRLFVLERIMEMLK